MNTSCISNSNALLISYQPIRIDTTMNSGNITAITSVFAQYNSLRRILPEIQVQTVELLLALAFFVTLHSLRQKNKHGLPSWPLVGMLPSMVLGLRHNVYEWVTDVLVRQGGTFTFRGPWFTDLHAVLTADPLNMEHLLKTKFLSFPKGGTFRNALHDLLGDGIFNADDETWRRQRKTASIEFHSTEFRALTASSLFELVHSRLLPVLEQAIQSNKVIDLQNILLRLTFDNVCMIAFGVDPGCLQPSLPEISFARAFEDATEIASLRFIMPTSLWKAMRYLDVGTERKLKRSIKSVHEFGDEVIRTRKKELEMEGENASRSDLLTVFMRLKDDNGKPYSDKFLRDICVNFILAGRDTSSVALAWFFWLVECNPDVEGKILEELHKIVQERKCSENVTDDQLVFRPEEVKRMEYLQAALSETLRLYPSVPIDMKQVVEDEVFPDGMKLKKGTKIMYAIYSMGRMESIWGNDFREFKPERWLRDGKFMSESAYKFAAFNGGPRLCLGKDFAYYQMKFVAASILYRYSVRVVKGHQVVPKLALTLYMKHGLMANLYKRHGTA